MSEKRPKPKRGSSSAPERFAVPASSGWARLRTPIAIAAMMLGIVIVYLPPACVTQGQVLFGGDHFHLHAYRIRYFQEALAGSGSQIPGWYTRELLGTPFRANIQSFPWIPSRLVLLWMDPFAVLTAGTNLAACLAGLFTFLFCRRLGLGRVASAAGGFTFACSGFFASRVLAGHLPLLEAYPALPLLLWLTDRLISGDRLQHWRVLALGFATTCIVLAGHPQLSIYSIGVATLYALLIGGRRGWIAVAAMVAGGGVGAFALVPTALLAGRSTRVLPLDIAANDIPFPYKRLLAFVLPWRDGWSELMNKDDFRPFTGYPNAIYFWDTVCYVGLAPLAAAVILLVRPLVRPRSISPSSPYRGRWICLGAIALLAMLLALPFAQPLMRMLPGTFLRSPARQIYIPIFVLALCLAGGCDLLLRAARNSGRLRWVWIASTCLLLAAHGFDLFNHDRPYLTPTKIPKPLPASALAAGENDPGFRVAIDSNLSIPSNRQIDDIGFFDSLLLAGPYRLVMTLSGAPATYNTQVFNGSALNRTALAWLGVQYVMTDVDMSSSDRRQGSAGQIRAYEVPSPSPRAVFVPAGKARQANEQEIREALLAIGKSQSMPQTPLLLDRPPLTPAAPSAGPSGVRYVRQDSDTILLQVGAAEPGYVRVMESADPGWHAELDGQPVEIATAFGGVMAIPIPVGAHEVVLSYSTPGTTAGMILSGVSLLILVGLEGLSRIHKRTARQEST